MNEIWVPVDICLPTSAVITWLHHRALDDCPAPVLWNIMAELVSFEQLSGDHLVQEQPELAAQGCAQLGVEYLCGWRLHHLSQEPAAVFNHPHSKRMFCVQSECLAF